MQAHQQDMQADADTRFLISPGSLGEAIRQFDWSTTPLGPMAHWPQSLKTSISLMLNSRQPMWIGWGPQTVFLYNDAYIDVLGVAKHPWALGRPMREVWAEIWDICEPMVDVVMNKGESIFGEDVRLFMSRGDFLEETYFSFSYSPIRDESGNVAGLFCPNLDATAKYLNARRLRTLTSLSARTLLEKTVQASCASAIGTLADNPYDIPFSILYLFNSLTGIATIEQSAHIPDHTLVAPAVIDLNDPNLSTLCPIVRTIRTLKTEVFKLRNPEQLQRGLANQPITEAIVLPVTVSGQKEAVGVLLAAINPTRRLDDDYRTFFELLASQVSAGIQNARAAEEEKLRVDMLAELDRAKTLFFSNVSHEFRTPLTLMLAPIEDALNDHDARLPPPQQERIELVRRNALRLQKLVNNLLDFSRTQAGRAQAAFVPVDLAELTADLASSFRSMVEQAGMQLNVECSALPETIYVDMSMWEKIVLNLLSNAFKFTFEGSITVKLSAVGAHAVLTVTDTGVGIPADELPRLFERFHRVEGSRARTHEGSGIGLALVQDLVALHGGEISAESEENCGTTFYVTIPPGYAHLDARHVSHTSATHTSRAQDYLLEAEKWLPASLDHEAPVNHAPSTVDASAPHILVADDNADMRDYLQRLLQDRWHVTSVGDGQQALDAIRVHAPDLIVSDAMMPQLDGFGLLAAIRADAKLRDIPFFMLSARAGEESRVEGLQAGADEYLVKPFSGAELIVRIESMLLRRRISTMENAFAQRMRSIFAQAPVAIAITRGPNHVFELANQRYMELAGNRELLGIPLRDAFPELEGQDVYRLIDDVYLSGQPYIGSAVRAELRRGKESRLEECFFNFVHQPLFDQDGNIEGVAIVSFEVTELINASRSAEAANRAKDEFLAMLGHELRNPLAPIVTALQLMRLRGVTVAEKERSIIERQAKHLVALVDDLLDVSRVAQGKIQLRKSLVETAEVIAKAIETSSPLLEEKRHNVAIDVPSTNLRINADPNRLAQVVANLLTNAGKYTEAGGNIRITAYEEGNDAVIAISDSGIGISPDMLPMVFDMFVQERQALNRSRGGLGLGLAIAKSLTTLHDGAISAYSEGLGKGSTFILRIPLAEAAARNVQMPKESHSTTALASDDSLLIMIVDDNVDAALLLADALTIYGHRTLIAHDGFTALTMIKDRTPDVGLFDIGLPGMDGYELAQRVRTHPTASGMLLIAITGYGQQSDHQRALQSGFTGHMVKPVDMKKLKSLIDGNRDKKSHHAS